MVYVFFAFEFTDFVLIFNLFSSKLLISFCRSKMSAIALEYNAPINFLANQTWLHEGLADGFSSNRAPE